VIESADRQTDRWREAEWTEDGGWSLAGAEQRSCSCTELKQDMTDRLKVSHKGCIMVKIILKFIEGCFKHVTKFENLFIIHS